MVGVVVMKLRVIHHSLIFPFASEENEGFDLSEVHGILRRLETLGVQWEVTDSRNISEEELGNLYLESTIPTARKKYRVRQVFGSKRRAGGLFGREVPALLVYESGKAYPVDVLPHRRGTRLVTIRAFLDDLFTTVERSGVGVAARSRDENLVSRMDRLRKKIGPIGGSVTELVHEGRRR